MGKLSVREFRTLAERMAEAYVAGQNDGNYLHWSAMKDVAPAISRRAINAMQFVLERLREDEAMRDKLLTHVIPNKQRKGRK